MVDFEIGFGKTLQTAQKVIAAIDAIESRATGLVENLQKPVNWDNLGKWQLQLDSLANNIARTSEAVMGFLQPGIAFEQQMAELQAGTGVTDEQLKQLGDSARSLAVDFGVDVGAATNSYLEILSKLNPELAKSPEYLADMGKTVTTLAKGMRGDLGGATSVLTTMMNAYNIDTNNAAESARAMSVMTDMLTASFKAGSVEVPQLAASMEALGAVPYQANISLSETLGLLQILGQKGSKYGAEAGNALRNVAGILAQGELMPTKTLALLKAAEVDVGSLTNKSLTFAERLEALKKVAGNDALLGELFGRENVVAGQALLQNLELVRQQTAVTQDASGAAKEYADTLMGTVQEQIARTTARFKDYSISVFESMQPYVPAISLTSQLAVGISSMLPILSLASGFLKTGAANLFRYGLGLTVVNGRLAFNQKSLAGATIAMGRFALTTALSAGKSLVMFTGNLIRAAVMALPALIASTTGAAGAQWLLNTAMSANPIGIMVLGAAALAAGFIWLVQEAGGVEEALWRIGEFVLQYNPFSLLAKGIDYLFGTDLMGKLTKVFDWAVEKMKWLWDSIKSIGEAIGITSGEVAGGIVGPGADSRFQKQLEEQEKKLQEIARGSGFTDIAGGGSATTALPSLGGGSNTKKGLEGVAGGGKKVTNITINLQKLQDQTVIHSTNIKEGAKEMEKEIMEALMRVLNGANQYTA